MDSIAFMSFECMMLKSRLLGGADNEPAIDIKMLRKPYSSYNMEFLYHLLNTVIELI